MSDQPEPILTAADARAVHAERRMAEALLQMVRLERRLATAERAQDAAESRVDLLEAEIGELAKVHSQRLRDAVKPEHVDQREYRRGYDAGYNTGKRGAEPTPEKRRGLRVA